jgi:hypothetical protein
VRQIARQRRPPSISAGAALGRYLPPTTLTEARAGAVEEFQSPCRPRSRRVERAGARYGKSTGSIPASGLPEGAD